jgi:hypothetical protein
MAARAAGLDLPKIFIRVYFLIHKYNTGYTFSPGDNGGSQNTAGNRYG